MGNLETFYKLINSGVENSVFDTQISLFSFNCNSLTPVTIQGQIDGQSIPITVTPKIQKRSTYDAEKSMMTLKFIVTSGVAKGRFFCKTPKTFIVLPSQEMQESYSLRLYYSEAGMPKSDKYDEIKPGSWHIRVVNEIEGPTGLLSNCTSSNLNDILTEVGKLVK